MQASRDVSRHRQHCELGQDLWVNKQSKMLTPLPIHPHSAAVTILRHLQSHRVQEVHGNMLCMYRVPYQWQCF